MADPDPQFRLVGTEEIYRGYVIEVVTADFEGPAGERFRRDVVRSPGAVAVVPVLQTPQGPSTLLVRQFRPAIGEWLLEIPAGLRDKQGEDPAATAARELIEETGHRAGSFELLTVFLNAAGMTDQRTHIYLATDLSEVGTAADGVEEAYLQLHPIPLDQARQLISSGALVDAKSLIGLMLALDRLGL